MARKILLLEIVGPSVTTLSPIAFDPATKGTTTTLANNNFTIGKSGASGTWSAARTLTAVAAGAFYFEVLYSNFVTSISPGVVNSSASMNAQVGALNGWGLNASDGKVYANNVVGATLGTFGLNDVIMVAVDVTNGKIWFGKNGVWLGGGDPANALNPSATGLTGSLYPAVSVFAFSSGAVNDGAVLIDDPALQQYQAPAGFTAGWTTSATVGGSNYYFASEGFTTVGTDTPPNQYYDPRIAADGDPLYDRSVTCAIWTNTNTSAPQGQYTDAPSGIAAAATIALGDITLNNEDYALDQFAMTVMRGGVAKLKLGYYGDAYTAFNTVATSIIDSVGGTDEHNVKVYLRGKMASLDKAIQSVLYNSQTANLALEGQPQPFAIGDVKWAPLVTIDPANLEYQLTDDHIGVVTELRDQGILITQGTGWSASAINVNPTRSNYGVRRLTNPAGRQCASYTGNVNIGSNVINSLPFGAWAAGVPAGFTKTIGANTTFVQGTGTTAVFGCTVATAGAYISTVDSTVNGVVGNLYYVEMQCTAVTTGKIDVLCSGHSSAVVIGTITKPGIYRFAFVATTATSIISFAWGKVVCSNIIMNGLTVFNATKIDRLPAWLSYLCVTRGGLVSGDIDTAGTINALDALAPYNLNFYCQDQTRFPDLLKATMDSFCGWIWEDANGVIKVGRLALPAATSVLTLTDQEIVGDITYTIDSAAGLSQTVAGLQNYSVHSQTDIATSLYVSDPTTAAQLQMAYLAVKKGNGTLSPMYSTAALNAAMTTLLTNPLHVAIEANRRTGMFNAQKAFYGFSAFVDDTTAYTLNPGDTITVQTGTQPYTQQRYDLTPTPGKNLLLIGVKSRFLSNKIDLVAWG